MRNQWKASVFVGLFLMVSTAAQAGSDFTFAVIGDRTGGAVPGVYEQVLDEVAFIRPDFMVTVGDHIEGYSADPAAIETEWDYVVGLLDGTGLDYHLTAGNHDIWDDQSRRIYERRFGSPDKAFEYEGSFFVIIDVATLFIAPTEVVRFITIFKGYPIGTGHFRIHQAAPRPAAEQFAKSDMPQKGHGCQYKPTGDGLFTNRQRPIQVFLQVGGHFRRFGFLARSRLSSH